MEKYILHNQSEYVSHKDGDSTSNRREDAVEFAGSELSWAQSRANANIEKGEPLFFPEKIKS